MNLLQKFCGVVIEASDRFGASMQGVDIRTHRARMYGHPDGIVVARTKGAVVARAAIEMPGGDAWEVPSQQAPSHDVHDIHDLNGVHDQDESLRRRLEADLAPPLDIHRPLHDIPFADLLGHHHQEQPWPHGPETLHHSHEDDRGSAAHDEQASHCGHREEIGGYCCHHHEEHAWPHEPDRR